jgi:hypothetical protein
MSVEGILSNGIIVLTKTFYLQLFFNEMEQFVNIN